MQIVTPQGFFQTLKNSHLLLDTNVFIDAFHNPGEYGKFFNELKGNGVTLVTVNAVLIEFTKGSFELKIFEEKKKFLDEIIDAIIPLEKGVFDNAIGLLKLYGIEGKDISIVDLLLGGTLVKYGKNIYLMTKDIKDFPANIYKLETHINVIKRKAIHVFGIYRYLK
ncbi:MAG: hypothetical protein Q7S45_01880 [Candidatus Curtissbacteria bacterium]|nr:hypothetical protein [Candidatus Curtissbacteria bacterium]